MNEIKAPLRDLNFVRNELFDFNAHYQALPSSNDILQGNGAA